MAIAAVISESLQSAWRKAEVGDQLERRPQHARDEALVQERMPRLPPAVCDQPAARRFLHGLSNCVPDLGQSKSCASVTCHQR